MIKTQETEKTEKIFKTRIGNLKRIDVFSVLTCLIHIKSEEKDE